MAMEDIGKKATLISGHAWDELKEMIDNRTYEPQPQMYSDKTVAIPEPPNHCALHSLLRRLSNGLSISIQHLNRDRLSGTAPSLTLGAPFDHLGPRASRML